MSGRLKLQIASDIHREFKHNPPVPDIGADVLVLAGDIGYANDETIGWIRDELAGRYEAILYIPGNHEFYGQDYFHASQFMASMAEEGGYEWMNNKVVEVDGQRFVGTPLWANFCHDPDSMRQAGAAINDFHRIWWGNKLRMTTDFMLELHEEARAFLLKETRPGDVVITHWPPTLKAAHPDYPMDGIARYFSADIPEVIEATKPTLWVCGHTHHNVNFMFGETRILSNQGGYPHEHGVGYNPGLIVEVGHPNRRAPDGKRRTR